MSAPRWWSLDEHAPKRGRRLRRSVWRTHPRLGEVRALVRFEGETRPIAVARRLGINTEVALRLLALVVAEGEP